ncbi:MAG: MarR family transcriptional regulator [Desulfovibrionaceae bacterium]|jgi:DNA-binding MarR family transcriptional regulator|nr:MarR family transcriptional regulator [Desulfovibrionaceae bacterium]
MDNLFFDPQKSLGYMTFTTSRLLSAFLRRCMVQAGIDLTAEQWGVLVHLWNQGGRSQEELAQYACVDKSSMSRVLAVMERRGLVERRPDPADARRKIIRPTEAAEEIRERSRAVTQQALQAALEGIGPEEKAACLNVLATVTQTLRRIGK